jgi:MoxR-like ATPase
LTVETAEALLASAGYLADRRLATAVFLALELERPLFLEGEAGVGKTELAKALAQRLGRRFIRLQCYEGLDISSAVYEWNVQRQMTAIRVAEAAGGVDRASARARHLLRRIPRSSARSSRRSSHADGEAAGAPHRRARSRRRAVRGVPPRGALGLPGHDPELGVVRAAKPPIVVVTSNRTREIHDAIKRRCLYHWVDYRARPASWRS